MKFNIKKHWSTILCSLIVLFTIFGKLTFQPNVVDPMQAMGLNENHIYMLAAIEIIALVLYVIPKTVKIGFLLLTAYYGGAIAFNLTSPIDMIPAIVFTIIIWVLTYIRMPSIFLNK